MFAGLEDDTQEIDGTQTLPNDVELKIQCESELKLFLQDEGLALVDPANRKKYSDCLKWWESNEMKYPTIGHLAKLFLAIPASSAPSERIWSRSAQYEGGTSSRDYVCQVSRRT